MLHHAVPAVAHNFISSLITYMLDYDLHARALPLKTLAGTNHNAATHLVKDPASVVLYTLYFILLATHLVKDLLPKVDVHLPSSRVRGVKYQIE